MIEDTAITLAKQRAQAAADTPAAKAA